MTRDLRNFWRRFQTGIEVGVGGDTPDKLLGVRDGFRRYFRRGFDRPVSVSVVPRSQDEATTPLPLADDEILELARDRATALAEELGERFTFYVGSEAGLLIFDAAGESRCFVRSWTVIRGLGDEAWGSSGSLQLPQPLVEGLDRDQLPFAVPGRRREGGMVSSLTSGLETRREATSLATFHALSSLLYGVLERRRLGARKGSEAGPGAPRSV